MNSGISKFFETLDLFMICVSLMLKHNDLGRNEDITLKKLWEMCESIVGVE